MRVVLISGLSGAGKTTALRILEDNGYYCIDNLPLTLLEQVVQIYHHYGFNNIALGIDPRTSKLFDTLPQTIKLLRQNKVEVSPLFLEATTSCLLARFSETRRKHPLSSGNLTVLECINLERELLANFSLLAQRIDTSNFSPNALRKVIKDVVGANFKQMNIIVQSFGFKYGLPIDADFVFDVRCLPNPYYDKNISHFNGTQAPIIDFLNNEPQVAAMLKDIYTMLSHWFDKFSLDHRNYLTIAIGCTGGKHRSVYLSEELAKLIRTNFNYNIIVLHRQLIINESAS